MRFVDLSAPITADPPDTPPLLRTEIEFVTRDQGARDVEALFGVGPKLLRDGEGWARRKGVGPRAQGRRLIDHVALVP